MALAVGALAAAPARADVGLSLAFVDPASPAFVRFRAWVDLALGGPPPYGFAAVDAAYVARVLGPGPGDAYCELAVATVEAQVVEAEAAIAAGQRPPVAFDSYLEVGAMIGDLGVVYDWCAADTTPAQRARWAAYAEQAVWNVWHHAQASWGGVPHPWSGWATTDPGNNYHFSFLEATMTWALASDSAAWLDFLTLERLPPLVAYFAQLPGGGSREGTGYGVAQMRLFYLYRLWRDSTGEDLSALSTHLADSIDYWIHASVPALDRYAPIGDLARESYPWLYDFHRRLVLEARAMATDPALRARASWWLHHISIDEMTSGFNLRHDLLPAGATEQAPAALRHHSTGTGHLFARSSWQPDAVWASFVAGPYDQSHAHQDQGAFNLFAGDFLAVTENVFSHSGIQQGSEVHNTLRFERDGAIVGQRESINAMAVAGGAGGRTVAVADLTAAFAGTGALVAWQRTITLDGAGLLVDDTFDAAPDVTAFFQVQVPVEPAIAGDRVVAGDLTVVPILPAGATVSLLDWSSVDPVEFPSGWRIQIAGAGPGVPSGERYVVRLQLPHVVHVDGFETGGVHAWSTAEP
ncbi:MAG: hypothetical protein F9K18_06390 [Thermoanaerobaculia bacterium]|nr:MAG: hypothetical protein F9K18_06390 [Thermoanaerobaculia bacterium]